MRPIVLRSHLLENCDVFVKSFCAKREGDESSCFSDLMPREKSNTIPFFMILQKVCLIPRLHGNEIINTSK